MAKADKNWKAYYAILVLWLLLLTLLFWWMSRAFQ
jgi:hypothetical protein